jgi:hypothetical protein
METDRRGARWTTLPPPYPDIPAGAWTLAPLGIGHDRRTDAVGIRRSERGEIFAWRHRFESGFGEQRRAQCYVLAASPIRPASGRVMWTTDPILAAFAAGPGTGRTHVNGRWRIASDACAAEWYQQALGGWLDRQSPERTIEVADDVLAVYEPGGPSAEKANELADAIEAAAALLSTATAPD